MGSLMRSVLTKRINLSLSPSLRGGCGPSSSVTSYFYKDKYASRSRTTSFKIARVAWKHLMGEVNSLTSSLCPESGKHTLWASGNNSSWKFKQWLTRITTFSHITALLNRYNS